MTESGGVLYGSDALGGVVNFVLRDQRSPAETLISWAGAVPGALGERRFSQSLVWQWDSGGGQLTAEYHDRDALPASARRQATSNLSSFGGSNFDDLAGNPATVIDGQGRLYAIPKGQDGRALTPAELIPGVNLHDRYSGTWVLPKQLWVSAFATGEWALSDDSQLTVDARLSRRRVDSRSEPLTAVLTVPSSNPFYVNPGPGQVAEVLYGFGSDLGPLELRGVVDSGQLALGFQHALDAQWSADLSAGYAFERQRADIDHEMNFQALQAALTDSDPTKAFNPFGDGSHTNPATLSAIDATGTQRSHSVLEYFRGSATGPTLNLPAGAAMSTIGAEGRRQSLASTSSPSYLSAEPPTQRRRSMGAVFFQTTVPLMSRRWGAPWVDSLEMSAGLRHEWYSDVGHVFTPQVGFTFSPGPSMHFLGSWTRLFRPPNLPDQVEASNVSSLFALADPRAASGYSTALVWTGQNAGLRPESAKTWSLGVSWVPVSYSSTVLAVTYFNTLFSNRIYQISSLPLDVLTNPQFSNLLERSVSNDLRRHVCEHSEFQGALQSCLATPIDALVDLRLRNGERLQTDGIDLAGGYGWQTRWGQLNLRIDGTYVLRYAEAATPTGALTDLRNTPHNPPAVRFRSSLGWQQRRFWISTALNYQGGYRDNMDPLGNRAVSDWAQVDATAGWEGSGDVFGASRLRLYVSAQNIFNTDPPFLNDSRDAIGYDPENGDLLGRRVSLNADVRW
jgi:outer membrane receptor protein involved in Fe transport